MNLGEPVNSAADDFCPTPVRGDGLYFVSREALPGSCGMADIYFTRRNPVHGWSEPVNLDPAGFSTRIDNQYFPLVPGDRYVYRETDGNAKQKVVLSVSNKTKLIATVEAYLASDCNLHRAAQRLFVHPKTMRYRLQRMHSLTGLRFDQQDDRFNLQLALKILRLNPEEGAPPPD